MRPTARLHYIYESARLAPNIVPDFVQIWIVVRDVNRDGVQSMTKWLNEFANGAAMATQTEAEF